MLSFAVVCEAPADQRTGCGLADRVFCAEVAWVEEGLLDHLRHWRGLHPDEPCLFWRRVPALASARGIRAHGQFEGEPGAHDAHVARRALFLLHTSEEPPHAIVLLRDDDRDVDRRRGLEQARRAAKIGVPIVIGLAHPKRECWVLAGFEPQNEEEQQRLDLLKTELGHDPRVAAERLTARHPPDKRSAKRVLNELAGGDRQREAECWRKTDLQLLAVRGQNTGLADYLTEVRERLIPLFIARPRPS